MTFLRWQCCIIDIQHLLDRYDENPQCGFDNERLHFAVHVRMGDRRAMVEGKLKYFELLEDIIAQISEAVARIGLNPPLFHVFSETIHRCPSTDTGLFDEFPSWPVALDQVREQPLNPSPCCIYPRQRDKCNGVALWNDTRLFGKICATQTVMQHHTGENPWGRVLAPPVVDLLLFFPLHLKTCACWSSHDGFRFKGLNTTSRCR